MATARSVALFGGAMLVEIPSTFRDVSEIRQVPDNQEVYVDNDGFTSIVFDILERVEVGSVHSDTDALMFHLSDVFEDDGSGTTTQQTWTTNAVTIDKLPPRTPAYTLLATQRSNPSLVGKGKAPDFTGVLLTLIRLVEQETDLVITVNVPHAVGEYDPREIDMSAGKHGSLLDAAIQYRDRILQTFEIRDWGLFIQE